MFNVPGGDNYYLGQNSGLNSGNTWWLRPGGDWGASVDSGVAVATPGGRLVTAIDTDTGMLYFWNNPDGDDFFDREDGGSADGMLGSSKFNGTFGHFHMNSLGDAVYDNIIVGTEGADVGMDVTGTNTGGVVVFDDTFRVIEMDVAADRMNMEIVCSAGLTYQMDSAEALDSIWTPCSGTATDFCTTMTLAGTNAVSTSGMRMFRVRELPAIPFTPEKAFVRGGQFTDLLLPLPIVSALTTNGLWGTSDVLPRDPDLGIEEQGWLYWGGNPIKDVDGKYYLAVARWPLGGHWQYDSEVVLCVSDRPVGPYTVQSVIFEQGHNPEVLRLTDGTYLLHTMWGECHTAPTMAGPWTESAQNMTLSTRGFLESSNMGSNLTTEYRPDGSIILMTKTGDVGISNTGPYGPYKIVATTTYDSTTGYAEDPVIWRSRHQYHAIYNHEQDKRSRYMRSLDGVYWIHDPGVAYSPVRVYTDGTISAWDQAERPKVVQDEFGRATYMAFGTHEDTDPHHAKNLTVPLVVEKLISITDTQPITETTSNVTLRIQAETDFSPVTDLDIASLRFGAAPIVNVGEGCTVASSVADGDDLLVTFTGNIGLSHNDYDLKLLGRTTTDDLVFGYALLPGVAETPATLISLPLTISGSTTKTLTTTIENCGLEASLPAKAVIYIYNDTGRSKVQEVDIPALAPYETTPVSVSLGSVTGTNEYVVVIPGNRSGEEYWRMVDHNDAAVVFSDRWVEIPFANPDCFMDSEKAGSSNGDYVTFTFTGTRARIYGQLGSGMGQCAVFIDGAYVETINCHFAPRFHSKLYQTIELPEGTHTLGLKKVSGGDVILDSFAFESASNAP